MKEIITELSTMSVIFALVCIFAFFRARQQQRVKNPNLDESLKEFAAIFGIKDINAINLKDLLKQLAKLNLVIQFSKFTGQNEFINLISSQNLKEQICESNEIISQEFISKVVAALKPNLGLGLYKSGDEFFAILCEKDELYALMDIAINLNENIIVCD
ncbi:hypothetical protein KDE12_05040 [Campylobacter sp. faydin G-105]|uniref:hypothetical protein n=1 Tax=Campylobacter anatolicus TaxID=2829105 RepID=UPI001B9287F3|nr:hypothetical protein [Campylobacter anatolicus]MBR8462222.1 hypothetical protein [Campylobacter anatolicus]